MSVADGITKFIFYLVYFNFIIASAELTSLIFVFHIIYSKMICRWNLVCILPISWHIIFIVKEVNFFYSCKSNLT